MGGPALTDMLSPLLHGDTTNGSDNSEHSLKEHLAGIPWRVCEVDEISAPEGRPTVALLFHLFPVGFCLTLGDLP